MLILDRFEEEHAWIEGPDGMFAVDRALLAPGAVEGDVLTESGDGSFAPDALATQRRREALRARLRRLQTK